MKNNGWTPCKNELPNTDGEYLTYHTTHIEGVGYYMILHWCNGWNCFEHNRENEIKNVVAWMPLPEPFIEGEEK